MLFNMQASTSVVVLALLVCGAYAKVSEDCLWGREDAAVCCKDIPEGDSTHLANPKECSSFYLCKNNKPMLWPCLPGQVWSVEDKKCTASSTPDQCPQKTFKKITTKKVSEDCLWGREDAETCCKGIPDGTHLANPKECSSFYYCWSDMEFLMPCLPGQVWSVEGNKCVNSDTPDQCPQKTFKKIMMKKVSEDCLWGREDPAKCCKDIPDGDPTHLANPNECSSFYLCKNNEPMLWPCLPGQVWSVEDQKCVKSDNPDQCPQKTFKKIMMKKVSEDCLWGREDPAKCCKDIPDGDPTHLANPKECSSFYLCKNNEPMLWPCLPGQVWSVEDKKCVKSDNPDQCPQKTFKRISFREVSEDCLWGREDAVTCCKDIPDGDPTRLANPEECNSFFVCENNKPVFWPCYHGSMWDVREKKCIFVDDPYKCEQLKQ